ncbi:MAG TPA: hypothetical protein VG164_06690 [Trebonia sp.]|jgi:hypothetical protein|nr:hypothetical protein [Trebonia sp.]
MAAILALDRAIFLIVALVVLLAVAVQHMDEVAGKIRAYVSARTRRMRPWHHDASGPPA